MNCLASILDGLGPSHAWRKPGTAFLITTRSRALSTQVHPPTVQRPSAHRDNSMNVLEYTLYQLTSQVGVMVVGTPTLLISGAIFFSPSNLSA